MSLIKKISFYLLIIFVSCCSGVIFFEIFYHFGFKSQSAYHSDSRYMLFDGSPNAHTFKNINNFFVYQPNQVVISETFYDRYDQWIQEYKYHIYTNNLGLVQKEQIDFNSPSVLLVGDSFTEGQGVGPWVNQIKINPSLPYGQVINGGLLGTGFAQWKLLNDYLLSQKVNIKYLVVVFISHDIERGVWNFKENILDCLSDYKKCKGDEFFYGTPPENDKLIFLNQLKTQREILFNKVTPKYTWKYFFPGTNLVIKFIHKTIKSISDEPTPDMLQNQKAISEFIKEYDDRILFIHIPQKHEVLNKRIDRSGVLVKNTIISQGSNVIDGLATCGLTIGDYFINDSHPNSLGYKKIADCVDTAMKNKWSRS